MLDVRMIRKDPATVAGELARRGYTLDLETFRSIDERRRQADIESQNLLAERKSASKKIGELVKQGLSVEDAKSRVNETLEKLSRELEEATEKAKTANEELEALLLEVPNLPHPEVPAGENEDDNREILRWGEPPRFDFEAVDHVAIAEKLGLFDVETAVRIAGSRFSVLYGELVRLQRALTQFMVNTHVLRHGYTEIYVPYIVNADSLRGTGQLPKFEEDVFALAGDDDYYLIPTAEVPVTNIARDRIFENAELGEEGLRFVCHSPCFRSEAGSYGRDTRGMIRQHQFEKVELVQLVRPADSMQALEALTGHAEHILQALELPYRKVMLCGGDMGFSAHMTYDLEVWLPGQSAYREISSCSVFGDFQARRMQARWRNPETGKPELLHTLNGSALAVGRTLVAVLENFQQQDGSVVIPDVLQPYMHGCSVLRP